MAGWVGGAQPPEEGLPEIGAPLRALLMSRICRRPGSRAAARAVPGVGWGQIGGWRGGAGFGGAGAGGWGWGGGIIAGRAVGRCLAWCTPPSPSCAEPSLGYPAPCTPCAHSSGRPAIPVTPQRGVRRRGARTAGSGPLSESRPGLALRAGVGMTRILPQPWPGRQLDSRGSARNSLAQRRRPSARPGHEGAGVLGFRHRRRRDADPSPLLLTSVTRNSARPVVRCATGTPGPGWLPGQGPGPDVAVLQVASDESLACPQLGLPKLGPIGSLFSFFWCTEVDPVN